MPLLNADSDITAVLASLRTIAVLGIKIAQPGTPAYYVPEYAQHAGLKVIPVPVYYPDVTEILGEKVYRRLSDIPVPIDAVIVFRKSADIPAHVDDILAAKPRVVWMQLGIRNDAVAAQLDAAGIGVVQDRCLLVEMQDRGR